MTEFELIIAGSGPAGITAAIYAQRLGLKCAVFGDTPGGSMYMIENLANFPGFPGGIPGTELGVKLFSQAQAEGAFFTMARIEKLSIEGGVFLAKDVNRMEYQAPAAIIATGRVPMRLPGKALAGINFCSVCDGPLYRDKDAVLSVVGSDNVAAQHAITLSKIARKVYLIFRSSTPKMDSAHRILVEQHENIEIMPETEVTGYIGEKLVEGITVKDKDNTVNTLKTDGIFLAMGWHPNLDFLSVEVKKTETGYLETDENLMTSCKGLFAAGDVRDTRLNQVLTACSDGANAAHAAAIFLESL